MSPSSTLHGFSSRCDTLMACVIESSILRMYTGKWCGTPSKAYTNGVAYATCAGQKATAQSGTSSPGKKCPAWRKPGHCYPQLPRPPDILGSNSARALKSATEARTEAPFAAACLAVWCMQLFGGVTQAPPLSHLEKVRPAKSEVIQPGYPGQKSIRCTSWAKEP